LLAAGGINNKSVKVITETSKVIKEQFDNRLSKLFEETKLTPGFFISSRVLFKLWKEYFNGQTSVTNDLFK